MKIEYVCEYCNEDAEISCEYESSSDYYVESYECGNCSKELNHSIIDDLAYEGVADWIGGKIDWARNMMDG
ncbi:MAG: hypothetical protein Q7R95_10585 [bacterium]|nr:hypothetical protein [bacterium]